MIERDRRERENNIVIRGVALNQENLKEQIEVFLEDKLYITGKIEAA